MRTDVIGSTEVAAKQLADGLTIYKAKLAAPAAFHTKLDPETRSKIDALVVLAALAR